ncbi:MAG TPA: SUMF1/EgtB/PvdO family nonheme iron enzyme [Bryobacteraceae bacterium]|jgi:hypothetical protein
MQLPSRIGKYELIEFLGGDTSEMYRARDTELDRAVIVRILSSEASSDAQARARFLKEGREAGVPDFGDHEGRPYFVIQMRESAAPSIVRLSIVVYALVLVTTAIAIVAWFSMRKAPDIPIEPSPHLPGGKIVSRMIEIPAEGAAKPFYIDTTEVTNAEFCAVIHCADASLQPGLSAVNVTVAQARQYASYKGERLPTASEWERAAHARNPAYRMIGNVWELVEDPATQKAEALTMVAGELKPPRPIPESYSAPDVGFRCARDP